MASTPHTPAEETARPSRPSSLDASIWATVIVAIGIGAIVAFVATGQEPRNLIDWLDWDDAVRIYIVAAAVQVLVTIMLVAVNIALLRHISRMATATVDLARATERLARTNAGARGDVPSE